MLSLKYGKPPLHVYEPLLRVIVRQNTLIQISSPKLNDSSFEVKFIQSHTARSISFKYSFNT